MRLTLKERKTTVSSVKGVSLILKFRVFVWKLFPLIIAKNILHWILPPVTLVTWDFIYRITLVWLFPNKIVQFIKMEFVRLVLKVFHFKKQTLILNAFLLFLFTISTAILLTTQALMKLKLTDSKQSVLTAFLKIIPWIMPIIFCVWRREIWNLWEFQKIY